MRLPLPFAAALALGLGLAAPAPAQTPPGPAPEATAPAASVPQTAQATPPAMPAPQAAPTVPAASAPAQAAPTAQAEAEPPAAPSDAAIPVPAPAAPVEAAPTTPTQAAPAASAAPAAPAEAMPASPAQAASTVPVAPAPAAPAASPSTAAPQAAADAGAAPLLPAEAAPADIPPVSLSPQQMFLDADIVVQSVMIGLVIASVLTWTVFLVKVIELFAATRRAARSLRRIEPAPDMAGAGKAMAGRSDPASAMLHAAAHEMARSTASAAASGPGVKERVASHLDRIEARASRRIARGTGLLAIVGSTAPFVGLFGTVWGIMNSFIGIAEAQTSNLAVVAPGIAEALLATGLGLVAAIPAVVIYNLLARATAGYRLQLGDASAAVQRLVSRELDREATA